MKAGDASTRTECGRGPALGVPPLARGKKKRPTLEGLDSLLRRERHLAATIDSPDLGAAGRDSGPDPQFQLEETVGLPGGRVSLGWSMLSGVVSDVSAKLQPASRVGILGDSGPPRRRPARHLDLGPTARAQKYPGSRLPGRAATLATGRVAARVCPGAESRR